MQQLLCLPQASVEDLKAAISKANPKYYPSRQRLTLPPEPGQRSGNPLLDGKTLTEYNLTNGSTVVFKDLGTQARRTHCYRCSTDTGWQPHTRGSAGWMDNRLLLGILRSLGGVSIVLLLTATLVPWNQVSPAWRLARRTLLCSVSLSLCSDRPAASKHHVQTWALLYWEFHYAKRILETFFVHRYVLLLLPDIFIQSCIRTRTC